MDNNNILESASKMTANNIFQILSKEKCAIYIIRRYAGLLKHSTSHHCALG
jgi:hypothetical protein